jgi:glycosyltransferase involved in cell wall biosynthesis
MADSTQRKISAVIMTYNEEKRIGNCIRSIVDVVDEIVIVDSFSSDKTREICKSYGTVFFQNKFEGYVQQRKFAISHASNDTVLVLDADELLSDALAIEIIKIKSNWSSDAYAFNRLTNYEGKWIRHCGWYPDKKTRLFDRTKITIKGKNPHDQIIAKDGFKTKWIKKDILHFSFNSISDHISKTNNFSTIAAIADFENGKKVVLVYHLFLKPVYQFINEYFIRLGILDGYYGFIICIISSFGKFLKYAKLRQLNLDNK